MKFTWDIALFIFLIQFFGYIIKWVIGFGNPLVSAMLALGAAKPIIRRVKSDTLQRLAIVFFLLGGISIIVKSLLTRT